MSNKRVRVFNKRVINRLTRHFARASYGPFALVRHVGRRSGTPYETPIMVERMGDRCLIALTYGPDVDWYRNVLAAGGCTLVWHGRVYALERPEPIDVHTALPAFPRFLRLILRLRGTQHFVGMQYREV